MNITHLSWQISNGTIEIIDLLFKLLPNETLLEYKSIF